MREDYLGKKHKKLEEVSNHSVDVTMWLARRKLDYRQDSVDERSRVWKNEDSSVKFLTKHNAMELEIDTYSSVVSSRRFMKNLKNTAKVRRDRLVMAIQMHEYNRESVQFLAWIMEMMAGARSEDTG